MANYGHGSHWSCVTENVEQFISTNLSYFLEEGKIADKTTVNADFFGDNTLTERNVTSIISGSKNIACLSLIVERIEENRNVFVSAYPFIIFPTTIRLRFLELVSWPNKFEGALICDTEDGKIVSFFDTKFFKNKDLYKIGEFYNFQMGAFAYSAKIYKRKTLKLEGEKANNYRKKMIEIGIDAEEELEPVEFDMSSFVSCISLNKDFPDDNTLYSPISSVERFNWMGMDFYKIGITIQTDPNLELFLYGKVTLFEIEPLVGENIQASIWLQGYL